MSNSCDGDNQHHYSGYEGDVSYQVSSPSTSMTTPTPCYKIIIQIGNRGNELKTETIWIGGDARDAGPGLQNDDEAKFGIIWIGCSACDIGPKSYQAFLDSDDQPEAEHVENVVV
ncbi:hypothetical protein BJX76DRAFT_360348 [Aspergillus varians]